MTSSTVFKLTRWAAVTVAVLSGIAMLLYPGGTSRNPSARGYSFFHNSLSDLGSTVAWDGQANSRGATFFLAGAIILALSGSGCLVALIRVYSSSRIASRLARAGGAAGLLTCAGLIGAALTPVDRSPALHGRFTLLAIGTFPVATALLALASALDRRLPRRIPMGWLVFTLVLVAWASVMTWRPTTDLELTIPVTLQKVVAITLLVVLTFQSYEAERVVAGAATTAR
jgi:hypothetical membrane protein